MLMPSCLRADASQIGARDHRDLRAQRMCGIFAAMTRRGLSSERRDAALKRLEHRGPDGSGVWTSRDGQWTLGHTRLSIIGLNNGSQPMTSPCGAVHLVVNGEFYGYREIRERLRGIGYRFATESDSEIALHLYAERGMQAATLLRGEFAMVIADERQRAMFGARVRGVDFSAGCSKPVLNSSKPRSIRGSVPRTPRTSTTPSPRRRR